ncbi:MAG: AmmeMemoRadiSam system protein B [Magnetococcales bacterium]|nr:AmmeMemoRadiSam system protein B [Magnetococcales bacterium]
MADMPSQPVSSRSPVLAGIWYPSDPTQLSRLVDSLLAAIKPDRLPVPVRALMVPHAGYALGGSIIAEAIRHIQGYAYRRVVVIGPAHGQSFKGMSLPVVDQFETPLGSVPLDTRMIRQLGQDSLFQGDPSAHEREPSIEILLPFLQQALGIGWNLVPVLLGGMGKRDFIRAAELIRPWLDSEDLLIISGDLTHYGPTHGYVPFPVDEHLATRIQQLDQGVVDAILTWDPEGLAHYAAKTKITASLLAPAILMLYLLHGGCIPFHFRYRTSAAITKSPENSISYCSGLFMSPLPIAKGSRDRQLRGRDLPILHEMAQKAMRAMVVTQVERLSLDKLIDIRLLPFSLQQKRGVFISITNGNELRRSLGTITPSKSLYRMVLDNVIAAVRQSGGFSPLTAAEFPHLTLKIRTISALEKLSSPQSFELGRHGLVLENGKHSAAYLPNIPIEKGWTVEETLRNLSITAGLTATAWQDAETHLLVFTVQSYPTGPESV